VHTHTSTEVRTHAIGALVSRWYGRTRAHHPLRLRSLLCTDLLCCAEEQAAQLNIKVLDRIVMELCTTCAAPTHVWPGGKTALEVALQLRATNPDALFMLFGPTPPAYAAVDALFSAMRLLDWMPKLISALRMGARPSMARNRRVRQNVLISVMRDRTGKGVRTNSND
jgi:hypothetical protein